MKSIFRNLIYIYCVCLFLSCNAKKGGIQYQYNDIIVTRIDKDATSYFFYGHLKNNELPSNNYIMSKYSGFDGSMDGYLVFRKDKRVELVPLMYFIQKGQPGKLSLKEYESNSLLNEWQDSIKGKYDSVIRISNNIDLEKERNINNKSKVEASYK